MPRFHHLAAACCTTPLVAVSAAHASTFHTFDPASLAQGGSGVAIADPARSTLANPAALSAMPESSDFNFQASAAARVFDEDDLRDAIDDFQDAQFVDEAETSYTNAENELEDFANTPNSSTRQDAEDAVRAASQDTDDLNGGLQSVTGKPVEAEFGGAVAASVPGPTLGVAVSYSGWGTVGATSSYDDTFLGDFADDLETCADAIDSGNESDCQSNSSFIDDSDGDGNPDTVTVDPENDLNSRVFARGIAVDEIGVTLSTSFNLGGPSLAIGVTPKSQNIQVFDYVQTVDDADSDNFDADRFTEEYDDANVDLGARLGLGAFSAGVTVRNAISDEYETTLGNTIEIEPTARAGVAYDWGWFSVAGDVDLTKNSSVAFADDNRFASVGATVDVLGWVQLRGGYRVNVASDGRDVASVGVGLSPFEVLRAEIAVAGNDNEVGGAATVGVTF